MQLLLSATWVSALQLTGTLTTQERFEGVVQKTYARYPVTISRGKGCMLEDEEAGKSYLDFVAGIATCCLGHGDPRLVKAVSEQIQKVHHVSNLYYIPEQGELAAWLVGNTPGAGKAFFCNSGGEANEAAIKLALKHATLERNLENPVILTAFGSFHGRTMATISATAQPKYHGPNGCWKIDRFDHFYYNDAASASELFAKHAGNVAAVLVEPVQGEGGVVPGDPDFFATLRQLCDDEGALLMVDEVQAGVGRTGKLWSHQHVLDASTPPDVVTCAKALGGGVPLGAMLCADHCDTFRPGDHATTYGGNPLACAAGLAVSRAIDDDGLVDNARDRGVQLLDGLTRIKDDFPDLVMDARGRGLLVGLELAQPIASKLVAICADKGLLLVPAGPNVVRFVPPLVVSASEVDAALDIITDSLAWLRDVLQEEEEANNA